MTHNLDGYTAQDVIDVVLDFCEAERSAGELAAHLGVREVHAWGLLEMLTGQGVVGCVDGWGSCLWSVWSTLRRPAHGDSWAYGDAREVERWLRVVLADEAGLAA